MTRRSAFYSSSDVVIADRTAQWPQRADAYEIPWLSHNTEALLIAAWLGGDKAVIQRLRVNESREH